VSEPRSRPEHDTRVTRRRIASRPFGGLPDGRRADLYELAVANGMSAQITNYGGIVVALRTPDRSGALEDVVLGYDRLEDYVRDPFFFGALIGRYANRIAKAEFMLGDRRVAVEQNEAPNHLHGGSEGFHKVLWAARSFEDQRGVGLELTHRSPDGHGGYPGNLDVRVVYTLTDEGELVIEYDASSDRDTIVNLTHHSYFNLGGELARPIVDHELVIRASRFTPVDATCIPTGALRDVAGTPFDFRTPTPIGSRIENDDPQLIRTGGYDQNWVLDTSTRNAPVPVARVGCPTTGRVLEVATTEPGLQFYSGNSLARDILGKAGVRYGRRSGFCLETQHFPDSPNKPDFPSVVLRAGERYRSTTVYRFGTLAALGDLAADF
jgi:aldose 1-epimerase